MSADTACCAWYYYIYICVCGITIITIYVCVYGITLYIHRHCPLCAVLLYILYLYHNGITIRLCVWSNYYNYMCVCVV